MKIVESKTPVIILSHHNCEIHCCHLDGYKTNTSAMLNRLSEIEAIFTAKPIHAQFRIWYNLDENILDRPVMELIIERMAYIRLG